MRDSNAKAIELKSPDMMAHNQEPKKVKGIQKLAVKFIPPPFLSPPDSDINIKPSEYLKKVAARRSPSKCAKKNSFRNDNEKMQRCTSESHLVFDSGLISDWCTSRTKSEEREKRCSSESPKAVEIMKSAVCSQEDRCELKFTDSTDTLKEKEAPRVEDDTVNKRMLKPIHGK